MNYFMKGLISDEIPTALDIHVHVMAKQGFFIINDGLFYCQLKYY